MLEEQNPEFIEKTDDEEKRTSKYAKETNFFRSLAQ